MICGLPGKAAEIEWKFLGYVDDKDVYEFTVVAPRGSPDAITTKSDVKFDGRRTPAFNDSNYVVVLAAPAESQPNTTNAAPDAGADLIEPNGEIRGRLTDAATGKPIEGATIACGAIINDSLKGGGANAITDAQGRYRLPVPSPGI